MATTQNRYSYVIDGDSKELVRATTLGEAAVGKLTGAASRLSFGLESVTRAAGPLAGALSVSALASFTRQTLNAIDALNDARDVTGSTVEKLSGLEDIARRNGGTLDDVSSALVKFNGELNKAGTDGKSGTSQALRAIGLDAAELRKQDPADALHQVAKALGQYEENGDKARLVQELFGKGVRVTAPLLRDLAEAGELNATVTTKQAEEAERLNKAIFSMQTTVGNYSRSLLTEAVPALQAVIDRQLAAQKAFGGDGMKAFATGGFGLLFGGDSSQGLANAKASAAELKGILDNLRGQASRGGLNDAQRAVMETTQGKLEDSQRLVDYYRKVIASENRNAGQDDPRELARRGRGAATLPNLNWDGATGGASGSKGDSFNSALDAIDQDFKKRIEEHWYRSQEALDKIDATLLEGPQIDPALLKARDAEAAELFRFVDTYKTLNEDLNLSLIADDRERALASIELERQTAQQRLDILKQNGEDIAAAQQQLDGYIGKKRTVTEEDFAKQRRQKVEGALKGSLTDIFEGDFKSIGERWQHLVQDMVTDALAADLSRALFGGSGAGGFGNLLGSLSGLFSGTGSGAGVITGGSGFKLPELATGTNYVPNDMAAVLHRGEAVVPKQYNPAAGGRASDDRPRVVINNTYNVGQGVQMAQVFRVGEMAKQGAIAEIERRVDRGARHWDR